MNRIYGIGLLAASGFIFAGCAAPVSNGTVAHQPQTISKSSTKKAQPQRAKVRSAVFSPNGKLVAVGTFSHLLSASNVLQLRELSTRKILKSWPLKEGAAQIAFSRDSQFVAVAGTSQISIWSVPDGKLRRTFKNLVGSQLRCAFGSDAQTFVISTKSTLSAWDLKAGKLKQTLVQDYAFSTSVTTSPNGKFLASTHEEGGPPLLLWDLQTLKPRRGLGEGDPLSDAVFSSDSQFVACTTDSGTHIWNTNTGQLVGTLGKDEEAPLALAFSRDNKKIISQQFGSGALEAWDIGTKRITPYSGLRSIVAISPDGKTAVVPLNGALEDVSIYPLEPNL